MLFLGRGFSRLWGDSGFGCCGLAVGGRLVDLRAVCVPIGEKPGRASRFREGEISRVGRLSLVIEQGKQEPEMLLVAEFAGHFSVVLARCRRQGQLLADTGGLPIREEI